VSAAHITLLGDSIFDNAAYTGREPDVISHLRAILPAGWQATLCAVDGATTTSLHAQIPHIPAAATHIVVAIGGNDALQHVDLLDARISSSAAFLNTFADRVDRFEHSYRDALEGVLGAGRDTTLCTIYNGRLEDRQARAARLALTAFNDVILRFAFERRLRAIELRLVCTDSTDYANPIEPSGRGGLKIARAIAQAVGAVRVGAASVYGSPGLR